MPHPLHGPELTLAIAGGKGRNLNLLARAGLPVPPGFVIDTDAYRAFVAANRLSEEIDRQWAVAATRDPATLDQASASLRSAFEQGELPAELAQTILDAYATLGHDAAVAVRSSATAEDLAEASFAGQQDTYLNVRGEAALLAAVKRCWGSLWTARAMAYRARQGIEPAGLSLAVVVQLMAPASAAGVFFTVNPVTGAGDEVVINATWGLGEALVAGRVNPDTVIADKATGRIESAEIGDKAVMTVPTDGGTGEAPVGAAQVGRLALTEDQVAGLVELGKRLEALLGGPQDVEWAMVDGAIVLLQSRPVTTAMPPQATVPGDDLWPPLAPPEPNDFDLWTQSDVGERWPEPVSPLTWSVWSRLTEGNMNATLAGLKAPYAGRIRWARRAFGHVYMNEGALIHAYTDGLGMPIGLIAPHMTNVHNVPPHAGRWQWSKVLRHLRLYVRTATAWQRNLGKFEASFAPIDRWVDEFMARDLDEESDLALWTECQAVWTARMAEFIDYHAQATSLSMSAYASMEALMARRLGDASLAQSLVGGLSGVVAAEMAPALWEMTRQLRALSLESAVLDLPSADALAQLAAQPTAQPFMASLERFLQRHGHRCMTEAEMLFPRWREEPAQVIALLAGYLRAGSGQAEIDGEGAARRRVEATARVEANLNPLRRAQFRRSLASLHRLTRLRDNGQNYLVKLFLPARHLYAVLGQRWAARGWLDRPEDVFFLVLEEMEPVAREQRPGAAGVDLRQKVRDRRLAYEHWFTQQMPDVLDAAGRPVALQGRVDATEEGQVLHGLAASRGVVTGRARVILSPADAAALEPGDILVTRATDPGWTPVFSVIGGAVLEIGGLLSHGAIVAREYGLPAVVNVPQATQRLADGQVITVDGDAGRVLAQRGGS